MLSEVAVEYFVGIDAGELSDDFDGQNLVVGEFRSGATLSDVASSMRKLLRSARRPPLRLALLGQRRA